MEKIRINGEWSEQQRNKKILKLWGWDIYTKRSFGSDIYKEKKSDVDAGKQVPRMLRRLYSFRKMSSAAEAKHCYLKEQGIFKPSVRQELIYWTLAMQAT